VCFQHPELGIAVPHVAAADDFQRIPVVGRVLRSARAFYIPRGRGRQVAEVNEQLERLAAAEGSLMFFIEGQRSRSRLVIAPKRGLLRGLQATGQTFTILPVAMAYDRVPEAAALEKELAGADKPPMSLQAIVRWLGELGRGRVALGRVHIGCGEPLVLDGTTDVRALSQRIVAQQQAHTAVSRFHLRSFLGAADFVGIEGAMDVDEAWLAAAIEARGGRVLASSLAMPEPTPALAHSLRNQWMHWFFADAIALYPDHPVIRHHVERHGWAPRRPRKPSDDPRVRTVVDALFAPILADYALVLRVLERTDGSGVASPRGIARAYPEAHLPIVEDALALLQGEEGLRAVRKRAASMGTPRRRGGGSRGAGVPCSGPRR